MRSSLTIATLAILFALVGCDHNKAVSASDKAMESLLKSRGFSAYRPFRTRDLPGTIFIRATNHEGWTTETRIASAENAFFEEDDPQDRTVFDVIQRQDLEFASELSTKWKIGGSLAVEFVSVMINPELSAKYFRSVTITLKDPKVSHYLDYATVRDLRTNMRASVKEELRERRDSGELPLVYMVHETIQVAGIEIRAEVKSEFVADLGLEKVKELAKLNAKVDQESESVFTISNDKAFLIGYKAFPVPAAAIATATSTGDETRLETLILTPEELASESD